MKLTLLFSSFLRFAALLCAAAAFVQAPARAAGNGFMPSIYAFNVFGPATINHGESATLNWSVGDADTISISPDIGVVTSTYITVTPQVTTTYTLTATNGLGSVSRTRTITVYAPPAITSFTASAGTVEAGAPATLSWSVTGATELSISPGVGAVTGSTSVTVHPTASTLYTLTATNDSGSVTQQVTVNVPQPPAVVHSLTATPAVAYPGQAVTLSWVVTGTDSLWMSADNGGDPGSMNYLASTVVHPTETTRYALSAWSPVNGSVWKDVYVTVSLPPPPTIASFTATPATIPAGSSTTLAWSTQGATEVSIAADIGTSPGIVTGNSLALSPGTNTTYTLTAKNISGTATSTVSVIVMQPPVIESFAATPASILLGETSQLSWSVSGATSLSISANLGASPGPVTGNSVAVSPTGTTLYTLTASNGGGTITQTIAVTVSTPVPLPTIASFTASPETISSGSSTLSWSVSGATSLSIMANVGSNPGTVTGTSFAVSPLVTTVYTLTATNDTGSVSQYLTVTVTAPPVGIAIESLTATPDTVAPGAAVTLAWVVTGTDSLWMSADNGGDPGSMNGKTSVVVHPLVTTRYSLSAFHPDYGSVSKAVIVTVGAPPPAVTSLLEPAPEVTAESMPVDAVECDVVTLEDGTQVAMIGSRSGEQIVGRIAVIVPASVARVLSTHLVPNAGYGVTAVVADGAMSLEIAPGGAFVTTSEGTLAVSLLPGGEVVLP